MRLTATLLFCPWILLGAAECPALERRVDPRLPRGVPPQTIVARFAVNASGKPGSILLETPVAAGVEAAIRSALAGWRFRPVEKPFEARVEFTSGSASASLPSGARAQFDAAREAELRKDYRTAAALYRRAADQGLPEAQLRYGLLLKSGYGEGVDLVRAVGYLLLAERAGLDDALVPARNIRPAVHEDVLQLGEEFADNHQRVCELALPIRR
jgi:hypothetical protein